MFQLDAIRDFGAIIQVEALISLSSVDLSPAPMPTSPHERDV